MGEREIAKLAGDLNGRAGRVGSCRRGQGSRLPTRAMPHRVFRVRREISVGAIRWAIPAQLWQADAPPEAGKPRVGVKIVQTRVRGQINGQIIAPILVCSLQPGERLVFFTEACSG